MPTISMLLPMIRKLETRAPLTGADKDALLGLNWKDRVYQSGAFLAREGSLVTHCNLLVDGISYGQKIGLEGARQILGFHIPGDLVDLPGVFLRRSDHNIQTLTRCHVLEIEIDEISNLLIFNPQVARACWMDTLIDGSVLRQWLMNVGRKNAKQRLAHLFCELALRLKVVELGCEKGFRIPITQEQLGDATGLSPVHVSRSIKALENEGLIKRDGRDLSIPDWDNLCREADFLDHYLHLDMNRPGIVGGANS